MTRCNLLTGATERSSRLTRFRCRLTRNLPLKKEFLAVRTGVSASSFKVGDRLILLRKQGGQEYLILDKKGAL